MNKVKLILFIALMFSVLAAPAQAVPTFSGSLGALDYVGSTDGSLVTLPEHEYWNRAVLSWTIDYNGGMWHYSYTLDVRNSDGTKGISHLIIEVSPTFDLGNLIGDPTSNGYLKGYELGSYSPGGSNPGMPDTMDGLKFDAVGFPEYYVATIAFDSDRAPVWGDFYAKDGTGVYLYNTGFTDLDTDPLGAPSNGSIDNHLLVPDTTVIPAPGALLLGSMGVGIVGWLRKRRTL